MGPQTPAPLPLRMIQPRKNLNLYLPRESSVGVSVHITYRVVDWIQLP